MEKGTVNDCNSHFEIDEIVLKIRKKTLSNCPTFEQGTRADIESHVDSQGSHPPPQQVFLDYKFLLHRFLYRPPHCTLSVDPIHFLNLFKIFVFFFFILNNMKRRKLLFSRLFKSLSRVPQQK